MLATTEVFIAGINVSADTVRSRLREGGVHLKKPYRRKKVDHNRQNSRSRTSQKSSVTKMILIKYLGATNISAELHELLS